ncbi:YadA-like family protein [Halomonas denitrificans]|uniref:YadA-like family protein n=1 Tax=Halomonas denitrificans TaxID=370769 RepID=UPI0039657E6E
MGALDAGVVKYDLDGDDNVDTDKITLAGGTDGTTLTNVADGGLTAESSDAVNGSQLFATNERVSKNEGDITNLTTDAKYYQANSTGTAASATGTDSLAMGPSAVADKANSVAIGNGAKATVADSVALGNGATTAAIVDTAKGTVAGTEYTFAGGDAKGTVSVGTSGAERTITNVAAGQISGTSTDAVNGSQLYATNAEVDKNRGDITTINSDIDALENGNKYYQANSTLNGADASGTDSLAMGPAAKASATNSVAIGNGAKATVADSVALGNGATTSAIVDTAKGTVAGTEHTFAGGDAKGTVSVGAVGSERTITNVAAGRLSATSTDAVNGSQLFATNTEVAKNRGDITTINSDIANLTTDAKYYQANSTGTAASATGADSLAMGPSAVADKANSVAIGNGAKASVSDSVALGNGATTAAIVDTAKGTVAGTEHTFAGGDAKGTVSVGAAGSERTITNVAAGRLSATSTDAVNGSQLHASNLAIDGNKTTIDGHTAALADLKSDADYYQANSTGAAASATGADSLAMGPSAVADKANSVAIGNGAKATVADSVALGNGATTSAIVDTAKGTVAGTEHTFAGGDAKGTVSVGAAGSERTITNVAAGQLSATSTDAVNGSQLFATNTEVAKNRGDITTINSDIANLTTGAKYYQANSTGAAASATGADSLAMGPSAVADKANSVAIGHGANASVADSVALGNGATTAAIVDTAKGTVAGTEYTFAGGDAKGTVSVGAVSSERTVTNVAAGQLSATSTDAVNGSQLYATNQAVGALDAGVVKYDLDGDDNVDTDKITLAGGTDGTTLTNVADGGLTAESSDAVNGSQLFATNERVSKNEGDITNLTTDAKYYQANSTGAAASATGADSLAMGPVAKASATNSVAIGNGANASVADSVALGNGATTAAIVDTAKGTVAGTEYTFAGGDAKGTVSVGAVGSERTITHVAAGQLSATSTDAVNGSQLFATNTEVAKNRGDITTINSDIANLTTDAKYYQANSTGAAASATGIDSLAMGPAAKASATNSVAIGNGANASVADSVALGNGATTAAIVDTAKGTVAGTEYTFAGGDAKGTVSVGAVGSERTITNVAAGRLSATSTDAVNGSQLFATNTEVAKNRGDITTINSDIDALESGNKYYQAKSTLDGADASGTDSLAMGPVAKASASNSVAIGNGANASIANSVALGNGATTAAVVDTAKGTVVGTEYTFAGGDAKGTVSVGAAGSERTITNVAAGQLSATSTDAVNGSQLYATNQAVGALDAGVVKYDLDSNDHVDTDSITLAGGTDGTKLTNMAKGNLTATSTDAVNGSQLYATNQAVGGLDTRLGEAETDIGDNADNISINASAIRDNRDDIQENIDAIGGIEANARYYKANSTGDVSVATGVDSLAMGPSASAMGDNSLAIGKGASVSVASSVALGSGAKADRAIAPVSGQFATGSGEVAYNTSDGTLLGEVSVGRTGEYRQVTHVADGVEDHDAVTLRQLKGAIGSLSDTNALFFHANGIVDEDSVASGDNAMAAGPGAVVNADDAIGVGYQAKVEASAAGAIAIGDQAHSSLADAVTIGSSAHGGGEQSVALGAGAKTTQAGAVALGAQSVTEDAVATNAITLLGQSRAVAGSSPLATVSIGSVGKERTLTHLAAGRVAADSTDAVNGSQLFATHQAMNELVAYDRMGDGSVNWGRVTLGAKTRAAAGTVLDGVADGKIASDSKEAVNGSQLKDTNDRVARVEGDVDGIEDAIDDMNGDVAALADNAVQYDADSDKGQLTLGGTGGTLITNVADGSISQGSSEAVNGGQVWDLMEDVGDLQVSAQDSKYFQANSSAPAAQAKGDDSIAIGGEAVAESKGGVALGSGAIADREGMNGKQEAFSDVAVASSQGALSVGSEGSERQITHVAGGTEDTDAVNVRQLKSVQEGAVNYDRKDDGSVDYGSVSLGKEGEPVQIHNVASGTSTYDAVNLGQLNALDSKFSHAYDHLSDKINEVERDASGGIAALAAMADAPYVAGKFTYHIGTGYHNGESALGVSLRRTADDGRWSVGLGIGASHGGPTVGLGVSGVID